MDPELGEEMERLLGLMRANVELRAHRFGEPSSVTTGLDATPAPAAHFGPLDAGDYEPEYEPEGEELEEEEEELEEEANEEEEEEEEECDNSDDAGDLVGRLVANLNNPPSHPIVGASPSLRVLAPKPTAFGPPPPPPIFDAPLPPAAPVPDVAEVQERFRQQQTQPHPDRPPIILRLHNPLATTQDPSDGTPDPLATTYDPWAYDPWATTNNPAGTADDSLAAILDPRDAFPEQPMAPGTKWYGFRPKSDTRPALDAIILGGSSDALQQAVGERFAADFAPFFHLAAPAYVRALHAAGVESREVLGALHPGALAAAVAADRALPPYFLIDLLKLKVDMEVARGRRTFVFSGVDDVAHHLMQRVVWPRVYILLIEDSTMPPETEEAIGAQVLVVRLSDDDEQEAYRRLLRALYVRAGKPEIQDALPEAAGSEAVGNDK